MDNTFNRGQVKQSEVKDPVQALPVKVIIVNLIKNPAYMFSVIAMTNICFVVTGL